MTTINPEIVVVECKEYEYIDVDPKLWFGKEYQTILNSEIDGQDVLRASFKKGQIRLQATSFVGVIPVNDVVRILVKPRVPLSNLTRMVLDTGHSVLALSAFREYAGRGNANDWIMDRYTDALLDYVDEVIDKGMLRSYERHQEPGYSPRGRIVLDQTIQRFSARGIPNKAVFSWYERTVNTPHNRCVKAALEVVYSHLTKSCDRPNNGSRKKVARLSGHFRAFDEVDNDPESDFLNDLQVTGFVPLPDSRSYYRKVLDLSILVLQQSGIALDIGGSDVQLGSLLINTNDLFEDFVRVSLSRTVAQRNWPFEVLDGNIDGRLELYDVPEVLPAPLGKPLLATASLNPGKAQPDVVLRNLNGSYVLIAEVKNTITSDGVLPDRSHVEQAVTYALRYGVGFALLVHPWSTGMKGLIYVGRIRSIDIYDFRLDLSSSDTIDQEIDEMALVFAALAGLEI